MTATASPSTVLGMWQRIDDLVAAGTTAGLALEAWTNPAAADHHQVIVPLLWLPVTLAVAVRRRRAWIAGAAAIAASTVVQTFYPDQMLTGAIAWMCCMYAFAIWTSLRTFVAGLAVYWVGVCGLIPLSAQPNVASAVFFLLVSTDPE